MVLNIKTIATTLLLTANTMALADITNISTRGLVGSGDDKMIAGFVVTDTAEKVIIAVLGETLKDFGVANVVADPKITVFSGSTVIAENDDWDQNIDDIRLTKLAPKFNTEAAIVLTLNPGEYTVVVEDATASGNASNAIVLVQDYDTVEYTLPSEGKTYQLYTRFSQEENTCLEGNVFASGNFLDGNSFMANCVKATGQSWQFDELTEYGFSGYYHLTTLNPENTDQCLEGNSFNPETQQGGGAFMANCFSSEGAIFSGQMWKLIPTSGGFKLQSLFRENENECLEGNRLGAGSTLNGAAFMDSCENVTGQTWIFIEE